MYELPTVVRFHNLETIYQRAVFSALSGVIANFRNRQRQLHDAGVIGITRGYYELKGARMMYTNINGSEFVDVEVSDDVIKKLARKKRVREAIIYLNFLDEVYVIEGRTYEFEDIIVKERAESGDPTVDEDGLVYVGPLGTDQQIEPMAAGDLLAKYHELFTEAAYAGGVVFVSGTSSDANQPNDTVPTIAGVWTSDEMEVTYFDTASLEALRVNRQIPNPDGGGVVGDIQYLQDETLDLPRTAPPTMLALRYVAGTPLQASVDGNEIRTGEIDSTLEIVVEAFQNHLLLMQGNSLNLHMPYFVVYHADDISSDAELVQMSNPDFIPWLRDEKLDPIPDVGKGIFDVL